MKVIDNFLELLKENDYNCRLENPTNNDGGKNDEGNKSEIHIFWYNEKKKEYGSVAMNYIKKYQRAPEKKLVEIIEKFTNKSIK